MKHKTRQEKLKFLRDVQAGKSSVKDMYPVQIFGGQQFEDEPDRITVYHPFKQVLTKAQFEEWTKTLPHNSHVVTLLLKGKTGQCLVDRSNVIRHGQGRLKDIVIDL